MPAKNAPITPPAQQSLRALGERLRARRKALGLSAIIVAEAAQVSRATLHRVELGEPAVTIGTYLAVLHALGLDLSDITPTEPTPLANADNADNADNAIMVADYPQLKALAWHIPGVEQISREEARGIYSRHGRHLNTQALSATERALMLSLGLEPPHV